MGEKISAGLLMYNKRNDKIKFFLVHPGGPYFKNKNDGIWSIPKGLVNNDENLLEAAKREFEEETSLFPEGHFYPIGFVKQKNNKIVYAWAFESKLENPIEIKSNTFEMEWPPRSGKVQIFPEVDKGEFFTTEEAEKKIILEQKVFIKRLLDYLTQK